MLTSKRKHLILSSVSLLLLATTQSFAAAVVDPTSEPPNVLAPYAVSSTDVGVGSPKAYRPWFENGTFTGDVIQYDISATGILSTDVDFSAVPPTATGSNWSARVQFDAKNSTYWTDTRKIIFKDTSSLQQSFLWANLSNSQQTALGSSGKLDYVRGDQSNEKTTANPSGTYRQRYNLLGDIIHSNPVYIATPDAKFTTLNGYTAFQTTYTNRAARVYVGSNDGMLHAFDAANGNEVYAYIPSMIIGDLDKLSALPATHTYFVDGQLAEGDADFDNNRTTFAWHSLLVGGLGSGGKGLFALDVTDPDLTTLNATTGSSDHKILWEIDGTDSDMGYIHGKPQIARLPSTHTNEWVVISGNGYGSSSGLAKLLVIDMAGVVTEYAAGTATSNGLSAPALVDIDGDNDIDVAYAGDLQGDMWKFAFSNTDSSVAITKMFDGVPDKPITSAPDVRIHPNGGLLVYFGTGSLLSSADAANTTVQSIYGIWDGAPVGNTTLLTQTLAQDTYSYDSGSYTVTNKIRTSTNTVINWGTHKGWQVDLNITGERLITKPIMRANRLQFVAHNPIAVNDSGLTVANAWLLELNYLNGGTGPGVFFDLNRDGSLNVSDKTLDGTIPVGVNIGEGSFSGPTIARVSQSKDTMFINGLFLTLSLGCTSNCSGGFQLGHIDVDTDSPIGGATGTPNSDSYCYSQPDMTIPVDSSGDPIPPSTNTPELRIQTDADRQDGIGGKTDGHQHEYDKAHGQVYVDYFNLEPRCAQIKASELLRGHTGKNNTQKLGRVTESGISKTKQVFAVVTNADFSPGSTFHIGAKTWNVVAYQKLVQQRLKAWLDPAQGNSAPGQFATYMVDPADSVSLLFNLDNVKTAGTLRNAFNDNAIASGGLHPTTPSCVKEDPYDNMGGTSKLNSGRWRGGALITQIIGVSEYTTNPDWLVFDNPTDLYRKRTVDGTDILLKEDTNADGVYDTFWGGVRARDMSTAATPVKLTGTQNPAFLYESTLFWHYTGSCYGSSNWTSDVNGAANANSTTSLKDTIASLEYDLETTEVALVALLAIANPTSQELAEITKKQLIVTLLKTKIQQIKDSLSHSILEYTGVVTPPTSLDPDVSPSLGPNFRTGRRTWIDLTP
jgi:hypothetical protein